MMSEGEHVIFNFSTIYWATGWLFLIGGTLSGAKRVITTNLYSPKLLVDIVNEHRVTGIFCPPSYIVELVNTQPALDRMPSMRHLISGGSPVSKNLIDSAQHFVPNGRVFAVYGEWNLIFISTTITS